MIWGIIWGVILFILKLIMWLLVIFLALLTVILVTPFKIGVIYPQLKVHVMWNGIKYTLYPVKKKKEKTEKSVENEPLKDKPSDINDSQRQGDIKAEETADTEGEKNTVNTGSDDNTNSIDNTKSIEKEETPQGEKQKKKAKKQGGKSLFGERFNSIDFDKASKLIKIALGAVKKILKGVVIERLYGGISVADKDKARLGITYGRMAALLTAIQPIIDDIFVIKHQHINLMADFEGEKWRYACDIIVYIRPITAVLAIAAAYIKIRKEGIEI